MIRRYRTHEIRIRSFRWIAALVLLWVVPVVCQTPQPQADVEARVDSLLKQLSLEEKIDLIGGVNDFYIRDIPHIHLPRLKMSDGPVGCGTTDRPQLSAELLWRRRGIRSSLSEWELSLAKTRGPAASTFCWGRA